ncbi:unnamed protein product [Porites evermanni]|uniref:Sulfatase N-terminal domain-containing protein n=1 Tax=Porites evermanni TaxID=104178 RepID=A0ABN8LJ01_9CNID|nr:unnamed protein product [Porites evermanni]
MAASTSFFLLSVCFSCKTALSENRNIIIFLTDNLSFRDLSIYGNNSQQTPNIDRLAREGVLFSRWYSQSSRISSLASILTGLLPPRNGMIKSKFLSFKEMPSLASTGGLPNSEITLGKVLKAKGYSTSKQPNTPEPQPSLPLIDGELVPKLITIPHGSRVFLVTCFLISRPSDSQYTWESVFSFFSPLLYVLPIVAFIVWYNGYSINMVTVFIIIIAFIFYTSVLHDVIHYTMDVIQIRSCVLYKNNNIIEQPYTLENLTLWFTRSAVSFLEESSVSSRPFFLSVSFMNLNQPVFASQLFSNGSKSSYSDALREVDWSIGRIVRTVRERRVDNNTIVIFTSATGHHVDESCVSSTPSENEDEETLCSKGMDRNDVWEQTICVPTVITWPGHITPNQVIKTPVTVMDIMPTVLELLNHSADALQSDGKSLLPVLFNTSAAGSQHEYIFHYVEVTKPSAITTGSYKVVYTDIKGNK